jgi:hypothetical protein
MGGILTQIIPTVLLSGLGGTFKNLGGLSQDASGAVTRAQGNGNSVKVLCTCCSGNEDSSVASPRFIQEEHSCK